MWRRTEDILCYEWLRIKMHKRKLYFKISVEKMLVPVDCSKLYMCNIIPRATVQKAIKC